MAVGIERPRSINFRGFLLPKSGLSDWQPDCNSRFVGVPLMNAGCLQLPSKAGWCCDFFVSFGVSLPSLSVMWVCSLSRIYRLVCFTVFGLFPQAVLGQFEDQTLEHLVWGSTAGNRFGNGLSFVDFNLDGWDDLTTASANGDLHFFTGGPAGFSELELNITNPVNSLPKSVIWADMDNDGDRDFMVSNFQGFTSRYWENEDGIMVDRTLEMGWGSTIDWKSFGLCLADYDMDGDLDVMFSNFHYPTEPVSSKNALFRNDLDSTFVDVSLASGIATGFELSFQAVWYDHNGDNWPDLYVVNDTKDVNGTMEMFPNMLLENQGDGTFVDVAPELGLDLEINAMTATVGDPDNDGELEVYCTDIRDTPSVLMDKDSTGVYQDVTQNWAVDCERWAWGSMWFDYDGDMWEDLFVATDQFHLQTVSYENYLLKSPGLGLALGEPFTDETQDWENGNLQKFCLVRGDVNRDGKPDFAALGPGLAVQILVNTPDPANEGHHWLTVDLCGTASNTEAIGSSVVAHAGGISQRRFMRAGEDLYSQHSHVQYFGMADELQVDSLEVFWPTGAREVFFDLPTDSAYQFVENAGQIHAELTSFPCYSDSVWATILAPQSTTVLCNGAPCLDSIWTAVDEPLVFVVEWFGGLFSVERVLDWSAYECSEPGFIVGCTYPIASNFNPEASIDNGSCAFDNLCAAGTTWSASLSQCLPNAESCAEDVNGDGLIGVADILNILAAYGLVCE
jgi:hypothetical protein